MFYIIEMRNISEIKTMGNTCSVQHNNDTLLGFLRSTSVFG